MKKILSVLIVLILLFNLVGCISNGAYSTAFSREGVYPYGLTAEAKFELQSVGLDDASQIIMYKAPKEAVSLDIKICKLNDDGTWECYESSHISFAIPRYYTGLSEGYFAMQLKDNFAIDSCIYDRNYENFASLKADEIDIDEEIVISAATYLKDHQDIELNTEIPVALMAYDSEFGFNSLNLEDYYDPSRLTDVALVQAVVFEFLDY